MMEYPIEEMNYKMKFINDKVNNGEKITIEEEQYVKKMTSFMKVYEAMCLEQQLKNVEIDEDAIIQLLTKKRQELVRIISGTKSKNKLPILKQQVRNIDAFIQSGAVEYFKDLLIDNNIVKRIDVGEVYDDIARKDHYLSHPYLENDRRPWIYDSPFIEKNRYTYKVDFNLPLIELTRHVIMGDFELYNAIKNGKDTMDDGMVIPDEMKKLNLKDISAIIYYGRGRIGKMNDHTFDTLKDDLDILVALDEVSRGKGKRVDDEPIKESIKNIIMGIIKGQYKVKDFTNYEILKYCDKDFDTRKFREILRTFDFDLELVKERLLQDDLLRTTKLNGSDNLFIQDGELNLANISLASSVINGEEINEDESLSADPNCLGRIKYYQPCARENPRDYQMDKYDVKALLALARYQEELKVRKELDDSVSISKAS